MSISTPRVKPVPGGPVRVATAVLAAVLALVLASTTEAASPDTTTEATASQDTMAAAKIQRNILPGKRLQELKRVVATKWARLFAAEGCNRYMGGKLCARLVCHGKMGPIANCTPMSAAFQQSFADATVEDIAIGWHGRHGGYRAAVKFSNGVVVVFNDGGGRWTITLPNRRYVRAATG